MFPKVQNEQPVQSVQEVRTKETVQPDLRQRELEEKAKEVDRELNEGIFTNAPKNTGKQLKINSHTEPTVQFVQQEQVNQKKQKKEKAQLVQAEQKSRKPEKQDNYCDLKTQKDRLLYALSELGLHYKDDIASNLHNDCEQFIEEFNNEKGSFSHAILAVIGYYYNDTINIRWLINGAGDPFPEEMDINLAA